MSNNTTPAVEQHAPTTTHTVVYMVEVFFYGEQNTIGIYRTRAAAQKVVDAMTCENGEIADIVAYTLED